MGESKRLEQWDVVPPIMLDIEWKWERWPQWKFVRTIAESLPYTDELYSTLQRNKIFKKISKIDDEYVLYKKVGNTINIAVVTRPIEAQKNMFLISMLWTLFFGVLTYLLSRYFVQSSLYRLEKLRLAVTDLDIDNLHTELPLEWPESDEVRIIGTKLQQSLQKIRQQTNALKDFVSNASHELKTPLMQIWSQADYLLKAKTDYEDWLHTIKKTTKSMNSFIDNLLTLAKIESQENTSNIEKIDISQIVKHSIQMHQSIYQAKNLEVISHITDWVEKEILPQHFEIIINNIISNAFKYTEKWSITVTVTGKSITIKDTWVGIQKDNTHKIRDKFRQEDSSKNNRTSYWLWLSLVKKTIDLYGWKIEVDSDTWGTTFIITMK